MNNTFCNSDCTNIKCPHNKFSPQYDKLTQLEEVFSYKDLSKDCTNYKKTSKGGA